MADPQPSSPRPLVDLDSLDAAHAEWEAEGRPTVNQGNDPRPDPA